MGQDSGQSRQDPMSLLHAKLEETSNALVAALTPEGFRIPLPDSVPVTGHRALPVPDDRRETMLDVIAPQDRVTVVQIWEQARATGLGFGTVHPLGEEDHWVNLTIVDAGDAHGTYLALMTDDAEEAGPVSDEVLAPLIVPQRPRVARTVKNMAAVFTAADPNVTAMLGWAPEELLGRRSSEFVHPDDAERAIGTWMQLLSEGAGTHRVRFRHLCADGSWLWVEVENVHNGAQDVDDVSIQAYISDISDEMAAHEALHRREQLFSRLAESLPTGVLQVQADGLVLYANTRLVELVALPRVTVVEELVERLADADRQPLRAAVQAAIDEQRDAELDVAVVVPGAGERRWTVTVASVADQEGRPGALLCISDVTERARMRAELEQRATFDALTSCLNRAATMAAVEQVLAGPTAATTAVVFVDLDGFKPVNDRYGHAAGDELLTAVAERLRGACRESDVVGRLGGDEFLLVCGGVSRPEALQLIADRVKGAFAAPVEVGGHSVAVGASVGVALAAPGMTAEDVVARADAAMYDAKHRADGVPVLWQAA